MTIHSYIGSTRTATLNRNWFIEPVVGDEYSLSYGVIKYNLYDLIIPSNYLLYPLLTGSTISSTENTIILDSNASSIDNYYQDQFVQSGTEMKQISSYNGTTHEAILSSNWINEPEINQQYNIKKYLTDLINGTSVAITTNTITLDIESEKEDGYYDNWFISINSQIIQIGSYTNNVATLITDWTIEPTSGEPYTLYQTLDGTNYNITNNLPTNIVTLNSSTNISSINNFYEGWYVKIDQQISKITYYENSTNIIFISNNWITIPSVTDQYQLLQNISTYEPISNIPQSCSNILNSEGNLVGSITLASSDVGIDDYYIGYYIIVDNQITIVTSYDGGTKIATLQDSWLTIPEPNQSVYYLYQYIQSNLQLASFPKVLLENAIFGKYVKSYIFTYQQVMEITYSNGNTISVNNTWITIPPNGSNFKIISDLVAVETNIPLEFGTIIIDAKTVGTILFASNTISTPGYYNGWFVQVGSQMLEIYNYNGTTKLATLTQNWLAGIPEITKCLLYSELEPVIIGTITTNFVSTICPTPLNIITLSPINNYLDNYYENWYVEVNNELKRITYSNGQTNLCVVDSEWLYEQNVGSPYTLYKGFDQTEKLLQASNYGINLQFESASSINNYYNGAYIQVGNQMVKIMTYTGSTKKATLYVSSGNTTSWLIIPQSISNYTIYFDIVFPTGTNTGTATVFSQNSIALETNSSTLDDYYNGWYVYVGIQLYQIISYNGSTHVATISNNWIVTPTSSNTYYLFQDFDNITEKGTSSNTTNTTITLDSGGASTMDDIYNGWFLKFGSFIMKIGQYFGSTRTAIITNNEWTWTNLTIPVTGTKYMLFRTLIGYNESGQVYDISSTEKTTTITLDIGSVKQDNYYFGWLIKVPIQVGNKILNETLPIVFYNSESRQIVTKGKFTTTPILSIENPIYYYLIDNSIANNVTFYHIFDFGNYTISQNLIGSSIKALFNNILTVAQRSFEGYELTDSFITYTNFFNEPDINSITISLLTSTTSIVVKLLNTFYWNIIKNLGQFTAILNTLSLNNPDAIHYRFGFFKIYQQQTGNYSTNIQFKNQSTISSSGEFNDNFTTNLTVLTTTSEPPNITYYYANYVNASVQTFHNTNEIYFQQDIFTNYFNDYSLWERLNISIFDESLANNATYDNMYVMNFIPVLVCQDVPIVTDNNLGIYLGINYPLYDFTNFRSELLSSLQSAGQSLINILVGEIGSNEGDLKITEDDENYLGSISGFNKTDNDLMLTGLFRPEVTYDYSVYTNLTTLKYVVQVFIDTATIFINTYDYDANGLEDLNTYSFKTIIIETVTDIINSFITPQEKIPSYDLYINIGASIYLIAENMASPSTSSTVIYSDAISSIWYNLLNTLVASFNNLFGGTILSPSYIANSIGQTSVSLLDSVSAQLQNINLLETVDFYGFDNTNVNKGLNAISQSQQYYTNTFEQYQKNKKVLNVKTLIINQIPYYYSTFLDIYNNAIANEINSHKSLYYPITSVNSFGTIVYNTTYVITLLKNTEAYLATFVTGNMDIVNYLINTVINLVSDVNPFESGTQLYQWYNSYITNTQDPETSLTTIQSNIEILVGWITSKSLYNDILNISNKYNNFYNETYVELYVADYILTQTEIGNVIKLIGTTWKGTANAFLNYYDRSLQNVQKTYDEIGPIYDNSDNLTTTKLTERLTLIINRTNPQFAWTRYLGYFLIDYLTLEIDGQQIDKHSGDFMYIMHNLYNDPNHERGLNIMIGNTPDMYTFNNQKKQKKRLYVPLQFWFCRNASASIPMVALNYTSITLTLQTKKLSDVACWDMSTIFTKIPKISCSLIAQYFYVEQDERDIMCSTKHEQLIETVSYAGDITIGKKDIYTNTFDDNNQPIYKIKKQIYFSNMCKELVWFVQPLANIIGSDTNNLIVNGVKKWYDYTYQIGTKTKTKSVPYFNKKTKKMDTNKIVEVIPINIVPYDKLGIFFNGTHRENFKDTIFYNHCQPVTKHLTSTVDGLCLYTFSLYPYAIQPSGAVNLSKISQVELEIQLNNKVTFDMLENNVQFRWGIYEITTNHLRIMSGMCGLAFYGT
jgi:hypothetical protein